MHKLSPAGFSRLKAQMYLRGRLPYTGDRGPSGAVHYLYEGYGGANIGDEIIHEITAGLLSPAHCVFAGRFRPPLEAAKVALGMSRASAVVMGGGTVQPCNVLRDSRLSRRVLPLYAFGLGAVGFYGEEEHGMRAKNDEIWEGFLGRVQVKVFGVRGPASLARFRSLVPEAIVTGDTALAGYNFIEGRKHEFIGVNFGRHFAVYDDTTLARCKRIVRELLGLQMPIVLIPMHDSDHSGIVKLLGEFGSAERKLLSWFDFVPSSRQFSGMLARMAFGVGERLHFAVPLIASGIPCAMLAYSDKHQDFAEAVGVQNYIVRPPYRVNDNVKAIVSSIVSQNFALEPEARLRVEQTRENLLSLFAKVRDELQEVSR